MNALALAELLCARVCHDLSGPVGATAAGAELFEDLGGGDPETLSLVSTSAAGAAARLRLLRAALGPASTSAHSLPALRTMVDAHLASLASAAAPAIAVVWRDCPDQVDGQTARLLLNLVLLGRDALPRGGRMELSLEDTRPALLVHGEPASLADDVKQALLHDVPLSGPRPAQAALTRILASQNGGKVCITPTAQGLRVAVEKTE
ncbi:MAG: histidine phosphotransferase family protein [Magnetospirillum sp.]